MPVGLENDNPGAEPAQNSEKQDDATMFALGLLVNKVDRLADTVDRLSKHQPSTRGMARAFAEAIDESALPRAIGGVHKQIGELKEADRIGTERLAVSLSEMRPDMSPLTEGLARLGEGLSKMEKAVGSDREIVIDGHGNPIGSRRVTR